MSLIIGKCYVDDISTFIVLWAKGNEHFQCNLSFLRINDKRKIFFIKDTYMYSKIMNVKQKLK